MAQSPKPVAYVSKEAATLFSDCSLMMLLKREGVDLTRPTRVTEDGEVFYLDATIDHKEP